MNNFKFLEGSSRQPTEAQMAVIMSDAKLTLCSAAAGSGKTQTMAWRVQRLIEQGCSPLRIVVLTFTNKAAQEITTRIGQRIGYCGTLHGYILRLLMCHGDLIGFPKNLTILDEDEAEAFLEHQLKTMNLKKVPKKELRAALAIGPVKGAVTPVALAVQGYYQKLQQTGTLDYDSMLVFGLKLVRELAKRQMVLGEHLIVDEVQDSGDIDFEFYRAAPFKNKTLVGDTNQSIYAFRGGNPRLFLGVCRSAAGNSDALLVPLMTNYRSDIAICEAANRLIRHNTERLDYEMVPNSETLGEVWLTKLESSAVEPRWIANDISSMQSQADIAVLCRTNHLVEEMSLALQASGIPVAKRATAVLPMDWGKCRLLVSLLCNPDNDYLALKWIAWAGTGQEKEIERTALMGLSSVNKQFLHLYVPPIEVVSAMMREKQISEDSIAAVDKVLATLPPDSTIHDLSLALAHNWQLSEEQGEGVQVMTIHASKGKEFDVVYLPSFEEGTIPGKRKEVDIEEERRLAYVAATRARHRLVITHCSKRIPRFGPSVPEPQTVSRYAMELMGGAV